MVQSILWRYIENEVEGLTFRLNITGAKWCKADQLSFCGTRNESLARLP
jgi:hypothetical protein